MLYEYRCSKNKKHITNIDYPKMSIVRNTVLCSICKAKANNTFQYGYWTNTIPAAKPTLFRSYYDKGLGQVVSSAKQIDGICKENNWQYVKGDEARAVLDKSRKVNYTAPISEAVKQRIAERLQSIRNRR